MTAEVSEFFDLSRWSSFDKIASLAQRIADRMRDAGLEDVRLIDFVADGRRAYCGWVLPRACDVEDARLAYAVDGEPGEVLADYRANPTSLMLYSAPTPPGGLTAEVVVADNVAACTPERVAGRLVLSSQIGVAFSQAAMRAGALGIVSDCRASRPLIKEGPYLDRTNEWHNYTIPPWDDENKGFGFAISPEQGRRLRGRMAGESVRLHAVVSARHYTGALPVISGRLRGEIPDEVVICGHYDEFGADDNCSQVTVALETARALRAMLHTGQIPPLRRSIRWLFPMEVRGFNALAQNADEIRHIRIGLNIDTVGTDQNATTTFCTLTESFLALPSFAEVFAAELLDRVGEDNPLFRWKPAATDTIDNIFGEPLIGAPMPALYHFSGTHHLALDTPERISARMLLDMARVTTTYAAFLANAGLEEALWLCELVADQGARRLREVAGHALRSGPAQKSAASLLREIDVLHEQVVKRLRSTSWLVSKVELFPSQPALAGESPALLGEARLLPTEVHAERVSALEGRLGLVRQEAQAQARRRAERYHGTALVPAEEPIFPSRCVPVKAVKGFLGFEDLSDADRQFVATELGIPLGWGAPMWLQNAVMLANGKRTAGEIAAILRRHGEYSPDVRRLEQVFAFLEAQGTIRLRPYLTQEVIEAALRAAGLAPGDVVLAHFSLSAPGYLEGGADGLIATLLRVLGPSGTLLVPTFTFSWLGRPPYDPQTTPSQVGLVTDCFWRRPGVLRSAHPTHSFAAAGKEAGFLISGHDHSMSPLAQNGPLGKLADLDGKVLMFGPLAPNTTMHVGEYRAGLPLIDIVCPILVDGARREVIVPDCPWHARFERAYDDLYAHGQVQDVALGEAAIHIMRCRHAIEAQAAVARANPESFVAPDCDCAYCQRLRLYCDERERLPTGATHPGRRRDTHN